MKRVAWLFLIVLMWACDDDGGADPSADVGIAGEGGGGGQAGEAGEGGVEDVFGPTGADEAACVEAPLAWEGCQFTDGAYHLAGDSTPSSAARTAAYDDMMALLLDGDPSADDFIDAAFIYGEDGGLGSRITRRYDAHIAKPEGADCQAEDAATRWPSYCVGPAVIEPLILDALEAGAQGEAPLLNARRVEAGALWFFYTSVYKESYTCAGTAKDCDSSWAYYGGGKQRDEANLGLGGIIQALDPFTHQRLFEALLGVRCWRDLDNGEQAQDTAMHARALGQFDAALDRAWASLLIQRLKDLHAASGDARAAYWESLQILGPVLDRAARQADAAVADQLKATFSGAADAADVAGTIDALNDLFPCPY
ncbi:hypothetical protein KKB55_04025 [Myxococcota bacterium]|nr:hypothetical protein [Myxococcota bacterium]MBU1896918.1 hypothetical protein [Myxococcota bacterium]